MIKGRWFLWAPLILAAMFYLYPTFISALNKVETEIIYAVLGTLTFMFWPYNDIKYTANFSNYKYTIDEIKAHPTLPLWIGYTIFFMITNINKYLDKHLTIKK